MSDTILDFIRHGKPSGTSTYRGHGIDDPLSDAGWAQMWDALNSFSSWDQIISSPLKRCSHFAEALAEKHQMPVVIDDRFKEVGFGDWEGRTREEIKANTPEAYEAFYQDPVKNRPPGAEPLGDFFRRVAEGYDAAANKFAGRHILVVAHAGVIRAVMAHVLLIPPVIAYRLKIDNAGITRIRKNDSVNALEFHNRQTL